MLLCLGPAVLAILCYDAFKDHEPSLDNKNAGGFLLLAIGWFSQGKDLWRLVARRRGRAWAAAVTFCVTMLLSGFFFFTWWPRDWAAWWVIFTTGIATGLILTGDDPAGKTTEPRPEPDSQPSAGKIAAMRPEIADEPRPASRFSPADPPLRPGTPPTPRRRWPVIAGVILVLFVVLGGAANFLFRGSGGERLREQWRAYLGSGDAQLALAWCYREGDDQAQDFGRAAYWLERAAKNDVVRAHYDLAVLCYYGLGVPPDADKTREHLEVAAARDYAPALTMLGLLARNDDGDTARAMEFWQRAAALHDGWGEHLVGTVWLERRGEGEENLVNALVHLERGRRLGVEPIKGMIEHVWATLDEADFERLADEVYWQLDGEPAAR